MISSDIHPTTSADIPALSAVLDATGLFPSTMLPDLLAGFLATAPGQAAADLWLTCHGPDGPVGFVYAVPEDMAEGVWNMRALAVLPRQQVRGHGSALVKALENTLRDHSARMVVVDTSGGENFMGARVFYHRTGYEEESRIRDFWAEGDDKITFRKRLR